MVLVKKTHRGLCCLEFTDFGARATGGARYCCVELELVAAPLW